MLPCTANAAIAAAATALLTGATRSVASSPRHACPAWRTLPDSASAPRSLRASASRCRSCRLPRASMRRRSSSMPTCTALACTCSAPSSPRHGRRPVMPTCPAFQSSHCRPSPRRSALMSGCAGVQYTHPHAAGQAAAGAGQQVGQVQRLQLRVHVQAVADLALGLDMAVAQHQAHVALALVPCRATWRAHRRCARAGGRAAAVRRGWLPRAGRSGTGGRRQLLAGGGQRADRLPSQPGRK